MSKPGTIYRVNWQAFSPSDGTGEMTSDIQGYIDISDTDNLIDDADEATVYDLQGSGEPATLTVIDNNEDPFTAILSQQLTINFESTLSITMSTFAQGSDQRWLVHYYIGDNTNTIFKGFLVVDDMSEALLPYPNTVTLTANDGLGLLKEIPLVNADDENPQGYHKISDYLTWALRKTGHGFYLYAAFNIKNITLVSDISIPNSDAEHFFYKNYLEAKTFEDEIGTSLNCYESITRILGEEAKLFQMKGQWWILRVDEMEDPTRGVYVSKFDSSGSFVSNLGEIHFDKSIGFSEDIKLSLEASTVTVSRPHKEVRLNYNFETPREVPCNIDFDRGDVIDDTFPEKTYALDCWTLREGVPGYYGTVDGTTATIHRQFNSNDYEEERYVVLTARTSFESSSINDATYIESEAIYINEKDKFSTSVDFRLDADIATGGNGNTRLFRAVLNGDDNSWWILGETTTGSGIYQWWNTLVWTVNSAKGDVSVDFDEDDTEYRTISWEAPPAPVSGSLYLWLNQFNQLNSADDNREIWYTGLQFDYIPFINGTYQKYSGQYHRTTQTGNYKAKREKEVYISDSPRKLFKGALHYFNGSSYDLSGNFYNAAVYPDGGYPSSDYEHPYGQIQLFDVWNQFRNEMRIVQSTAQGCDLDLLDSNSLPDIAHLINKWSLTDSSINLNNKFFTLLHFNQNHDNQEWTGVFREVFDTTKSKDYLNHEFKYIF